MDADRMRIEAAIAALESQRAVLGDEVVDTALGPLRAQLAAIRAPVPVETAAALEPPPASQPELRQATVLFADVVGSTALGSRLDAEDVHEVMNRVAERFTATITGERGRVIKYTGDGLLAAFGLGGDPEHSGVDAVRAGLLLHAEMAAIRAEMATFPIDHLQVRVGLNTGPVIVGGGVEAEANIRGQAVNLAARMEQHAPPGGVRISHETYRLVRGRFEIGPVESILVKGVDTPQRTYLVLGGVPTSFDSRAGRVGVAGGTDVPMIGRDAELRRIADHLDRVAGKRTAERVLVIADAGVGKSRLLEAFRRGPVADHGANVITGRAQAHTRHDPYGLLRALLVDLDTQGGPEQEGPPIGEPPPDGLAADDGDDVERLAGVLGVSGRDRQESLDERQVREITAATLASVVARRIGADGRPAVVILEDLHWADDDSLAVIDDVERLLERLPVLIVGTARPSILERPDAPVSGVRIDLAPLAPSDAEALVSALCRRLDVIPAQLKRLIVTCGDGVPFFIEETLATLIDEAVITVRPDGAWDVDVDRLDTVRVPTTLGGILQGRLDALSPAERHAAQRAAVLGHVFDPAGVEALGGEARALVGLIERAFVVRRPPGPGGVESYEFRHHLLHQFTYESLLKRDRRAAHRVAARWLRDAVAGADEATVQPGQAAVRPDEWGTIGEHHRRAEEFDLALQCYADAAESADRRSLGSTVIEYVDRALGLPSTPPDEILWRLISVRTQVPGLADDPDALATDLALLARIADRLDDDTRRVEVLLKQAAALQHLGDYAAALEVAERAESLAKHTGASDLAAEALGGQASASWRMGALTGAIDAIDAARKLAGATNDRLQVRLMSTAAIILAEAGRHDVARSLSRQAGEAYRRLGDRQGEARALNILGCRLRDDGSLDEAQACFAQTLEIARALGSPSTESLALINLAEGDYITGDLASALERAQAAADLGNLCHNRDLEAAALSTLGLALIGLGRSEDARGPLRRAVDLFEANGSVQYICTPTAALARIEHLAGHDDEALRLASVIVSTIDRGIPIAGIDHPFETLLTTYTLLTGFNDDRAPRVLDTALALIDNEIASLPVGEALDSYLRYAPGRRGVLQAAGRLTSGDTDHLAADELARSAR